MKGPLQRSQKGSVLLVSLVMLLLLSLIAVAGMQSTIMQDRMSSNLRDRDIAFQHAEAALREGEQFILDASPNLPTFDNENGLFAVNYSGRPAWGGGDGSKEPVDAADGEYFIEEITSFQPAGTETEAGVAAHPVAFFRVTARGFGGSDDTTVVVRSVVRAR